MVKHSTKWHSASVKVRYFRNEGIKLYREEARLGREAWTSSKFSSNGFYERNSYYNFW